MCLLDVQAEVASGTDTCVESSAEEEGVTGHGRESGEALACAAARTNPCESVNEGLMPARVCAWTILLSPCVRPAGEEGATRPASKRTATAQVGYLCLCTPPARLRQRLLVTLYALMCVACAADVQVEAVDMEVQAPPSPPPRASATKTAPREVECDPRVRPPLSHSAHDMTTPRAAKSTALWSTTRSTSMADPA
jgi:hypothetical protein